MELAALGLRVDARGAIRTLNVYSGSAANAGRATEKFERTTKNLTATLGALGGFFGVRQLVEYADTWTLINARVRIVTDTQEKANAVHERLFQIANRTRNTMAATSVLYTRVALNADQLGRSHEELLLMTESVNAALLISGATGVEAAQSMRQLAQALGSGRLQGDEFRTVMEAMPLVARAISDEMGVSVGKLKDLAADGLIDVQTVLDALIKKNEEWVEIIDDMPFTVGQAFEIVNNSMTRMVGILNQAHAVTSTFSRAMIVLSRNMDKVVAAFTAALSVIIAYRLALIATAAISSVITSALAIKKWWDLVRAVTTLAQAMNVAKIAALGLLPLIQVLTAVGVGLLAYRKILEEITKATDEWIAANADLTDPLGTRIDEIDEKAQKVLNNIQDMIREAHQGVVLSASDAEKAEELEITFEAINKTIEARRELQGELLEQMEAAIALERGLKLEALRAERAMEAVVDALEEQARIVERFLKDLQRSFADVFEDIFNDGVKRFSDLFDAIKRLFVALLAEMAAARVMQRLGPAFSNVLTGLFGASQEAIEQQKTDLAGIARDHMKGATKGVEDIVPVQIEGMDVTVSRSWASQLVSLLAPALAGFFIGQMIGRTTTNRTAGALGGALGGALSGAAIGSTIPGVGTGVGAIVGGVFGAIGGLKGSMDRSREEMVLNRAALLANNERLKALRDAFEGTQNQRLFSTRAILNSINEAESAQSLGNAVSFLQAVDRLVPAAQELGIVLRDEAGRYIPGSLEQFREAIELTILTLTQWGNNLSDVRARQEAYNKLFDVEDTPAQALEDAYNAISQLAPDLVRALGIGNLNLDAPAARAALLEGLREIFRMVESGEFTMTPELLGAFANIDELIDAVLRTKDAFDKLNQVIFDIVTDFPRAMDIAFYEQLYGRFTTGGGIQLPGGILGGPRGVSQAQSWNIGSVTIVNESNDTGESLLQKMETAVNQRRARGGSVDLDRDGENLF
jgi:tape measure domain-containing protein